MYRVEEIKSDVLSCLVAVLIASLPQHTPGRVSVHLGQRFLRRGFEWESIILEGYNRQGFSWAANKGIQ